VDTRTVKKEEPGEKDNLNSIEEMTVAMILTVDGIIMEKGVELTIEIDMGDRVDMIEGVFYL